MQASYRSIAPHASLLQASQEEKSKRVEEEEEVVPSVVGEVEEGLLAPPEECNYALSTWLIP